MRVGGLIEAGVHENSPHAAYLPGGLVLAKKITGFE
jgi:hypothetical protein